MKFYYIKNIILKLVFLLAMLFQLVLLNTKAVPFTLMSQVEVETNIESLYSTNPKAVRALKEALSKYRKYINKNIDLYIVTIDARDRLSNIEKKLGLNHERLKEALSKYEKFRQKQIDVCKVINNAKDRLKNIGKRLGLNHDTIVGMLRWSDSEERKRYYCYSMSKDLDKFFKEQTDNLYLMINMGHRLGIDHKKTASILTNSISSEKIPTKELVKKSANKDADKKELDVYLSLQQDLARKVLEVRYPFRYKLFSIDRKARLFLEEINLEFNDMIIKLFKQKIDKLIIINDKARLSMKEIDLELNDMIINLFKQKINDYKLAFFIFW